MEKHFRVGLCSGRTFRTAVHNKASHDCPLTEQQKNKEESLIPTLVIMKIEY